MANLEQEETMFSIYKNIMSLETQEQIKEVQGYLKTRRKDLSREVISELSKGDNVLIDNKGRIERGSIIKINRTRVVIDIENQGIYNVPFSMIRKEN